MHVQLSIYFIFCILTSLFYPHGILTTILLSLLLVIQQYLYCILMMSPSYVEPCSYCTQCKVMTTNSYIHCKECDMCVPVTYFHWKLVGHCVSKEDSKRYKVIVFIQLGLNLFLSLIQGILYPPFFIVFILTAVSCKSIMKKIQVNI